MAQTGRTAFNPAYQARVGQSARGLLHDNSKELVKVMQELNLLQDNSHIFEIGSGGARNLWYMWKENQTLKLSCNDFWKEESFKNMHEDLKPIITFHEGDTEDILRDSDLGKIDILLSSDHLMHVPRVKGQAILEMLLNKVKPSYIVLRERKKEYETPEETAKSYPRNYHDYEMLLEGYTLEKEVTSAGAKEFFIRVYKLK